IENPEKLGGFKKFLVAGMGGSHLAADLLKIWKPDLDLIVWHNYGLPPVKDLKERLVIASSYSGNTEETVGAFEEAKKRRLPLAVISSGGKLTTMAHMLRLPHVVVPSHIQPRMATGYMLKAILKFMGDRKGLEELGKLTEDIHPSWHEGKGKILARRLRGSVPVIYSSEANFPIAYNWKTKFNETGKIPAFCNAFPELNHNEMTGFDMKKRTSGLSSRFHFVFLRDGDDEPKIKRRMNVTEKLLKKRGFKTETVNLAGKTVWEKIFNSLVLADWTAYYTAKLYGVEPEEVPMVEEFKKLIG
ncbi:MAG: bifunctional phosphoglucose/phosphomannose isomerase, partial [Patescibacteria group bacterium]